MKRGGLRSLVFCGEIRKGKRMTATQVLLTAAMGVAVGVIGGFDIGYALGFDAGSRRRAGEGRPE